MIKYVLMVAPHVRNDMMPLNLTQEIIFFGHSKQAINNT